MRPRTVLTTTLIALLVLRVLAAPIAARPEPPRPPSTSRFIARVCAWPASRPQRFIAPAASARKPRAAGRASSGDLLPLSRLRGRAAVTASALRCGLRFWSHEGHSALHLSDCPRC